MAWLCEMARHADIAYFRRSKRGPKKPPPTKTDFSEHTRVTNKRVIDQVMRSPINAHRQDWCYRSQFRDS